MIASIKRIWAAAPVASVILAVALVAGVFFGIRATASWIYWNDPAHQNQTLAGWMTGGYIAHSWNLPRGLVFEAMDIKKSDARPRPIDRIAADRNVTTEELLTKISEAITLYHVENKDD